MITVPGTLTNCTTTINVRADTACVPALLLTAGNGVLAEVVGGPILYTVHDTNATPSYDSMTLNTGEQVFVRPAINLRMRRKGSSDTCVFLMAVQA